MKSAVFKSRKENKKVDTQVAKQSISKKGNSRFSGVTLQGNVITNKKRNIFLYIRIHINIYLKMV